MAKGLSLLRVVFGESRDVVTTSHLPTGEAFYPRQQRGNLGNTRTQTHSSSSSPYVRDWYDLIPLPVDDVVSDLNNYVRMSF